MSSANVALDIGVVAIDEHCVGLRWSASDRTHLARLIAIVAMGQATKAAEVIKALEPAEPDFAIDELCDEALIVLTVQNEAASGPRTGYPRFQRDGFMFEAISWIAARQSIGDEAVLKLPHTSATTQGLDGLMLVVDRRGNTIRESTIFEDKCTEDPRATFLSKVLPALQDRHLNKRSAELVSTASALLSVAGFAPRDASRESAKVLDKSVRKYRSAFAVSEDFDSEERRKFLFKRYEKIADVRPDQRIGACFVVDAPLRDWFDALAAEAVSYLQSLKD